MKNIFIIITSTLFLATNMCVLSQETKIIPYNNEANTGFANSANISGDYAIVGASMDDENGTASGSAFIYKRNGNSWEFSYKIIPDDGGSNDNFGSSVSLSGDYAIIGAFQGSAAYIFKRNGDVWIQEIKITPDVVSFVTSVSIFGDYAIVGDDSEVYSDYTSSGAAYIYKHVDGNWIKDTKIYSYEPGSWAFGWQVCMSDSVTIIAATTQNNGEVYIYSRNDTSWIKQKKLTHPEDIAAPFGYRVSINGEYAIISAGSNDPVTYIYKKNGDDWVYNDKLVGSDASEYGGYGSSVSIYNDYVLVGSMRENGNKPGCGASYLYKNINSKWTEIAKLVASDVTFSDNQLYGYNVSLDNESAIICSPNGWNGNESAYIYDLTKLPTNVIINRKEDDLISIYPNPANDILYLKNYGNGEISKAFLINQFGNKILVKNDNMSSISISRYPKGLYIIELIINNNTIRKKIIIN